MVSHLYQYTTAVILVYSKGSRITTRKGGEFKEMEIEVLVGEGEVRKKYVIRWS